MKEIGNGVYAETEYPGCNVGCIATDEGAVLVDTPMFPADAWRWLRRIARTTKHGLAYLVSTDYHLAHILGNCFFSAATIAHELAWGEIESHAEALLQRQIEECREKDPQLATELADVHIVLPEVAIIEGLTIYKGGRVIKVLYLGGHTPASIGVYVPDSRVLFAGDVVVVGQHPSLAEAESLQWLAALERIRGMDVETVVPGHGAICAPEDTQPLTAYIQEMRSRVEKLYQGGTGRRDSVEKVRNAMIDRFPVRAEEKGAVAQQIRGSIERVYEEIRKGS